MGFSVVNIALSCTIFELFDVLNNIVTLKSGLEVIEIDAIQKLWYGFLFAFVVTMAISCIVREI